MRLTWMALTLLAFANGTTALAEEPTAQALIDRHEKEKQPVWADGDTLTFFYRGDVGQVQLLLGGDLLELRRLSNSDVWTLTVNRPEAQKAVFSYSFFPGNKGQPAFTTGQRNVPQAWRGPQAPPAPARTTELKGRQEVLTFESKALGEKRQVRVYLPPGHDPNRATPVVYGTDGATFAEVLEPLITTGKIPPVMVVAPENGGYRGSKDPKSPHDIKYDFRLMEYLPGADKDRFARHEKFFSAELPAWAEKQFGAGKEPRLRAVCGCSNGARFAVEMGALHPDLFGHVFGLSVAGGKLARIAPSAQPAHYYLASGSS